MNETKPTCMRCGNSEFQVRYYYPSYWTARYQNGRWLPDHELHSEHRREVLFLACEVCGALDEETGYKVLRDGQGFELVPLNYVVLAMDEEVDGTPSMSVIHDSAVDFNGALALLRERFGEQPLYFGEWYHLRGDREPLYRVDIHADSKQEQLVAVIEVAQ